MSKIICDVCGTAYAENASQCPICGSVKRTDRNINSNQTEGASYQFVKGGRFSKRNVKKRNKDNQANKAAKKDPKPPREEEREHSGISKGLMIILLIAIAAALALLIYIGLKFFMPSPGVPDTTPPTTVNTEPSTEPSESDPSTTPTETDPLEIPCQGITLQEARIVLENIGDSVQIVINLLPANSTDKVTYSSLDEKVAIVDEHGYVLAVGHGETKVNVSCGDFSVNCEVRVTAPATEPSTDPSTEPTVDPEKTVELNRDDITMFYEGESWRLYIGSADMDEVIWSTDDEKVATFERGVVTAVGPGETVVYAEYGGQKVGCIIRCNWEPEPTEEPTEPTEEPTEPTEPDVEPGIYVMHINGNLPSELYGADVSLAVGESFNLTIVSPSGNIVDVDWQADQDGIVTVDGNTITGAAPGMVYVSVVYNDQSFVCIVRVS